MFGIGIIYGANIKNVCFGSCKNRVFLFPFHFHLVRWTPFFSFFSFFPVGHNRIFLFSVSPHYALTWKINKIWENFLSGIHFWTFLKMSIFKNSLNFFPRFIFTKILEIVFSWNFIDFLEDFLEDFLDLGFSCVFLCFLRIFLGFS